MIFKAVKYFEKGFHAQGFAFGGEDGMEHFDNNVKYCASLQNYLIDTGDDVILVDTGLPKETPNAVWDGKAHSYMGRWIEDYVSALRTAGYEPSQVTKIVLTHKHSDHSGEIRSFPNAKFYVNRVELETDEVKALKDHPGLTPVDFTDGPYYNFTRSQIIAPGVRMIPAPGHTYGNSIVIAEDGGLFYMFHGDISYTDEAIYADKLSIVYDDIYMTRAPRIRSASSSAIIRRCTAERIRLLAMKTWRRSGSWILTIRRRRSGPVKTILLPTRGQESTSAPSAAMSMIRPSTMAWPSRIFPRIGSARAASRARRSSTRRKGAFVPSSR